MGGKRPHHPRRGSLGYHPRKRARRPIPRIRAWSRLVDDRKIGGFPCYKAGTTHVEMVDDRPHSVTSRKPVATVATVLEAPPIIAFGFRAFENTYVGERTVTQVMNPTLSKDLASVFPLPKKKVKDKNIEKIEPLLEGLSDIRLLIHTQPRLVSSLPAKKPQIVEIPLAGEDVAAKYKVAMELMGKEIRISEIFSEGDYVDTLSITKGKGFQGPLKKWGVKHLPRKTRKGRRTAGTLGPWHPSAMMWTVPQSGQMGYHQRTEFNKRVISMGSEGGDVTPEGGFLHYGAVKNDYIVLKGSTPGPQKRLVLVRPAARMRPKEGREKPQILSISKESIQGV